MNNLHLKTGLTTNQLSIIESEYNDQKINKGLAYILWVFLATIAAHRFYSKDTGYAVCMLLFGWLTLFIWPVVDVFFVGKSIDKKNDAIEWSIINRVSSFKK